ncbi:unnamed protein product [Ilex paraguariensis]|uniref:Uncharacterized protein n=1 Tax=Ilex paraguariensis TaxID=185542 RepID=A0ABC8RKZ4_9AQUA
MQKLTGLRNGLRRFEIERQFTESEEREGGDEAVNPQYVIVQHQGHVQRLPTANRSRESYREASGLQRRLSEEHVRQDRVEGPHRRLQVHGLPGEADPSMLDSDDFLQKFHHALLELHLEEGALVCPETCWNFPSIRVFPICFFMKTSRNAPRIFLKQGTSLLKLNCSCFMISKE